MIFRLRYLSALLLGLACHANAQTSPDPQQAVPPAVPRGSDVVPSPESGKAGDVAPGGVTVTLSSIEISGNISIGSDELLRHLGSVTGRELDFAGLTRLASEVEAYYRQAGFPFAQAYLPPQDLKAGRLRIAVLEARYGEVRAAGVETLAAGAQPFLDRGLSRGDPIRNAPLERTLLILDDQPGVKIRPIVSPGTNPGDADLSVQVARADRVSGDVGFDNTGARVTGEYRLRGTVMVNSPFRFGDRLTFNGMVTDEQMWLGSVDYDTPFGATGLRGQVGYAHTSYQLGAQFAALDAVGLAKVASARLSYPLMRSQATNVLLSLGLQHKDLEDEYRAVMVRREKSSASIPVAIQFDKRDSLLGGGVTFGLATFTVGRLSLDQGLSAVDAITAKTEGAFRKANLDVARIQRLTERWSVYGRFSGQWAGGNLDPSEKFNLGGYHGVRAYPLGEGVGDKGWFAQFELRVQLGPVTPFGFYDLGKSVANAAPWDATARGTRAVDGAGVGLRSLMGQWSMDATLSWRVDGGASRADSRDVNPRAFFMLARRF